MGKRRRFEPNSFVNTVIIIDIYGLNDRVSSGIFRSKANIEEILLLENSIDALCESVLIAVKLLGHTAGQPSFLQRLSVCVATVLTSTI